MKQKFVALFFLTLCTCGYAQTPSSYLCVADKSTGFSFDKTTKKWSPSTFRTDSKYVVSRSASKGFAWEVKEVGQQSAWISCGKDFNEVGNLFCEGFGYEFRFSNGSLRFMKTYSIGYWSDANPKNKSSLFGEEGDNTPSIEIGKCSPL